MADEQSTDEAVDSALAEAQAVSWPITIKLQYPIEFGKRRIEELVMRRGTLGTLKGVSMDGVPPTEQLILIASRLAGEPTQVIEKLDMDDSEGVIRVAFLFFARCLPTVRTGKTR